MGWVIPAMMAGSALMGMMGNKDKHKDQTTKGTAKRDLWRSGMSDPAWDKYNQYTNQADQNINWGPSGAERRMFRGMMGQYGPGGGGGGGAGGGGRFQRGGGRGGGGGGKGGMKWEKKYGGQNVDYSDYESRVMGEDYMDVSNDPYLQAQQEYRRGLFDENVAGSRTAAMSPFIQAGGSMGLTGAAMGMQGKMQQGNERDWLGQENEMYMGERDARRQQAIAANQAWSGREGSFDSSAIGADSAIKQSKIGAAASRYATDAQYDVGMAGVGAQNSAQKFAQQQALFGMAGTMADKRRQGQGLGGMNLWGTNLNQQLPWQQGFGQMNTTNTTPGQGSQFGNMLGGAAGGAMQGYGMGKNMFKNSQLPWGK